VSEPPDPNVEIERGRQPALVSAVFCRRVQRQPDGSLAPEGVTNYVAFDGAPRALISLLLSLRSGDARGTHQIFIRQTTPPYVVTCGTLPIALPGNDERMDVEMRLTVTAPIDETVQIAVFLDAFLLTTMPLTIRC
jgi:hypothetical protein